MIETIIFDMGGVLYDFEGDYTQLALVACGLLASPDFFAGPKGSLLDQYEKGLCSTDEFIAALQKEAAPSITAAELRTACCASMRGFPAARIKYVQQLANQYSLYLLSNTSELHVAYITEELQVQHGIDGLDSLFIKPYLSYQIGLRKPDLAIYQHVIAEQPLTPSTTLFIDDRLENIVAARQCGLQGLHKPVEQELLEVLPEVLLCQSG